MIYREFTPHPCLRPFIECYWKASADSPPFRKEESLIPDGTIELMFNFGDDYDQVREGMRAPVKGSHIIGIRKKTLQISQTRRQEVFSVRFRPGGTYPFFRIPVHLFANAFWNITELLGKAYYELEEQLFGARDDAERIHIIDSFLLSRMETGDDYRFVSSCSRWILEHSGASIADTCRTFGTHYKNLERKFSQVIGLTPTELLKIRRFNSAILAMYSKPEASLTDIAYSCGFYDQSHFIREFKQLSGYTPKAFLKAGFTIVRVIQPALADRVSKSYNL
ncbi:AraC family transcriptional regulator [Compostibacter hankyongensis]|uniref:Helix-turn-helix domain-containing protein n=1 Tax=Compostibacter hankyongensis TaxID=1007089 RepID=A0ABP8FXV8_9BACT